MRIESDHVSPEDQHETSLVRAARHQAATAMSATRPVPKMIASYRIIDVLGRGGMGVVYRAEQRRTSRIVALKVIQPQHATTARLRRFEYEAEYLGRLRHAGIARIYEADIAVVDGEEQPFLAMEWIESGHPITRYAMIHDLDLDARLELLAAVADAVQHAHERGVIHRDLKPGNIIVSEDGQPKILDFGVARALDLDTGLTIDDAAGLVGTFPYMSPEQATGVADGVDVRSDVYSLGVIAYELVTGSPPYSLDDQTVAQIIRTICDTRPRPLRELRRDVPADLETVVLGALAKNRDARYRSAGDLASDLRRIRRREPIAGRYVSPVLQLRMAMARHPWRSSLAIAAVALLLTVAIAWPWHTSRIAATAASRKQLLTVAETIAALLISSSDGDTTPELFAERLNMNPLDPVEADAMSELYGSAGRFFWNNHRADTARRFFHSSLQLDIDHREPSHRTLLLYVYLAKVNNELELYDAAASWAALGLGLAPAIARPVANDAVEHLRLELARSAFASGDAASAIRACRTILDETGTDVSSDIYVRSDTGRLLGTIHLADGAFDEAAASLTTVIDARRRWTPEDDRQLGDALLMRSIAGSGSGRLEQAASDATMAIDHLGRVETPNRLPEAVAAHLVAMWRAGRLQDVHAALDGHSGVVSTSGPAIVSAARSILDRLPPAPPGVDSAGLDLLLHRIAGSGSPP